MSRNRISGLFFQHLCGTAGRGLFLSLLIFFLAVPPLVLAGTAAPKACGSHGERPCRIVSLSPSVTETLFAIGLGAHVVGVTRFCSYPPEACKKPGVGGYIDPNYEAIVSLNPDVAVLLPEQAGMKQNLATLGIDTVTVDNKRVEDILLAIETLGQTFGAGDEAAALTEQLRGRIKVIRDRTANLTHPAVLVSVARGMGSIGIKTVYIAGRGGYFDELLDIVGGRNVYRDKKMKFPRLSWEGLLGLNPDIILDLVPSMKKNGWDEEEIKHEWETMKGLRAVRDKRVYVLGEDYVTIPGPRFILLLEDMAGAIHPEVKKAGG